MTRSGLTTVDCRLCLPATLALAFAVVGVGYGLTHDDPATALGALLFVPSAVLLFGIVRRRNERRVDAGDQ